jgi:antitoxin (DNA-binding transcriptional repressor) of toxin-antitoxin stability system
MTRTLPIEQAQTRLAELISTMSPGEQLILTVDGTAIAILSRQQPPARACQPGTALPRRLWMSDDFDAPLDDFHEFER